MTKRRKKSYSTFIIICILAVIAFAEPYFNKGEESVTVSVNEPLLKVHFIDVKQGDSTLFEFPDGKVMLVDAGENEMGDTVVNYLLENNIDKIDYLVGTHPHSDHIGGLDDVIRNFEVGTLYMPDKVHDSKTFQEVIEIASAKGINAQIAKRGVTVTDEENLKIKFLSPVSENYESLNNYSSVVSVKYCNASFLVMGDAEYVVEKEILNDLEDCDVLRVGHHGSNSSSTANFLKKVMPEYVVISVGCGNAYGHPHKEVLNRLKRFDAEIYRTDSDGHIVATSDGFNISFETERNNENYN